MFYLASTKNSYIVQIWTETLLWHRYWVYNVLIEMEAVLPWLILSSVSWSWGFDEIFFSSSVYLHDASPFFILSGLFKTCWFPYTHFCRGWDPMESESTLHWETIPVFQILMQMGIRNVNHTIISCSYIVNY